MKNSCFSLRQHQTDALLQTRTSKECSRTPPEATLRSPTPQYPSPISAPRTATTNTSACP